MLAVIGDVRDAEHLASCGILKRIGIDSSAPTTAIGTIGHAGPHGDLDEAAAAEPAEPVALGVVLRRALGALGEHEHQLLLLAQQAVRVVGLRGDAADARPQRPDHGDLTEDVLGQPVDRPVELGLDAVHDRRRVGRDRARVVGDEQRAAVGRDLLEALPLDPEPAAVDRVVRAVRASARMCSERPHSSTSLNRGSARPASSSGLRHRDERRAFAVVERRRRGRSVGGTNGEPTRAPSVVGVPGRQVSMARCAFPGSQVRQHWTPAARGTGLARPASLRAPQLEPAADTVADAPRRRGERRLGDVFGNELAGVEVVAGDPAGRHAELDRLDQRVEPQVVEMAGAESARLQVDQHLAGSHAFGDADGEVDLAREMDAVVEPGRRRSCSRTAAANAVCRGGHSSRKDDTRSTASHRRSARSASVIVCSQSPRLVSASVMRAMASSTSSSGTGSPRTCIDSSMARWATLPRAFGTVHPSNPALLLGQEADLAS